VLWPSVDIRWASPPLAASRRRQRVPGGQSTQSRFSAVIGQFTPALDDGYHAGTSYPAPNDDPEELARERPAGGATGESHRDNVCARRRRWRRKRAAQQAEVAQQPENVMTAGSSIWRGRDLLPQGNGHTGAN